MFEIIGMIVVWVAVGYVVVVVPTFIGGTISGYRKDDGSAFYLSLALSYLCGGLYIFGSLVAAAIYSM